jgi:hypothetical protein
MRNAELKSETCYLVSYDLEVEAFTMVAPAAGRELKIVAADPVLAR